MIFEEHVIFNSDGLKLEGILSYDENTLSPPLVLLCPPHPHLGGDMENNVTHAHRVCVAFTEQDNYTYGTSERR